MRALVGSAHGTEPIPAERFGRILGYERERYLKQRRPPRLAVALTPNGTAAQPQRLADGDWRLARRIVTPDVEAGQAALVGARLCARVMEAPETATLLWRHIADASKTAFQSWPASMPSSGSAWTSIHSKFLAAQPHSPSVLSPEQRRAEQWFEAHEVSGLLLYFGSEEPVAVATPLTSLRVALPTEHGETFDDLVRRRAGSPATAHEVLAFIEEWGCVVDELRQAGVARPVTLEDYIQRWHVPQREARERLRLFNQILPQEYDPSALWEVLWDTVPVDDRPRRPAFIRLISQPVIDTTEPPTLAAYFLGSVHQQLTRPLGERLARVRLRPQEEPSDTRRDLRRLYQLAEIATHRWSAAALTAEADAAQASLVGLASIPRIEDDGTAAIAEQAIGSYRQHANDRGTRAVLLNTQKCLRECAALPYLNPPAAVTPLLPGVRSAAAALAVLCSLGVADPAAEVSETMAALYAIP